MGEEALPWRFDQPSLPHVGGLLFQEWVCDAYSRAEAQRLAWVVMNQDQLRAETYQGLVDAVNDPGFISGVSKVGSKVILPATYPGSPRAMQRNYLEAMRIVKRFWEAKLFHHHDCKPFVA